MRLKALLFLLIILPVLGQSASAHKAVTVMDEYREPGSERIYLFMMNDTRFGTLSSTYKGQADLDGHPGHLFRENLELDYSAIGNPLVLQIESEHYTDDRGRYLGENMTATAGEQVQRLSLIRSGDSLTGHFESAGTRRDINLALSPEMRAIDNNMIDQLESFLAFRSFEAGNTLSDSAFTPQVLVTTPYKVVIDAMRPIRYGDLVDSAYVCRFMAPAGQVAYFTADNRLIRLDLTGQNISIILSESPLDKTKPQSAGIGLGDLLHRLPLYLIFLLIGAIYTLPFIRKAYRHFEVYLALVAGALVFLLLDYTQVPLQRLYATAVLIPAVKGGASIYLYAIVSALLTGVVQEILKLIPIAAIDYWRRPRRGLLPATGLFCGLGFGIYEAAAITGAAYQSGAMPLISWGLFERIVTILFHGLTGFILAYGLQRGTKALITAWVVVVLAHSLINYTILFYQKGTVDTGLYEIIIAFFVMVMLLLTFVIMRRRR